MKVTIANANGYLRVIHFVMGPSMKNDHQRSDIKQWAKEHIKGRFVTMSMPETPEWELDSRGIASDVEHYLTASRVDGLYLHGLYGNFAAFTVEERKRATEEVVKAVKGRARVVCSCEHPTLKATVELVQHAEQSGVDMIALTGPWLAGNNAGLIVEYVEYIAERTSLPLLVDNIGYVGYAMSPQLMARLAELPTVAILKNVMPLAHTIELRKLVGDNAVVVDPTEENLLINMTQFGQRTVFDGGPMLYDNQVSTPMRDYFDAALRGDNQRCAELYYQMQPLRDLFAKWIGNTWHQTGYFPIATVKCWIKQLGLTGGPTRPAVVQLSQAEEKALIADLAAAGKIAVPSHAHQ